MTPPVFVSVIEGHGEVEALRVLLNIIVAALNSTVYPSIATPIRVPWGTLVNIEGELERYAAMAFSRGGPNARLFVLLDADDSCPAELGPELLRRVTARFPRHPVSVNIANREYESWFIASSESIASHVGRVPPVTVPQDVEGIRGAKRWLEQHILGGNYKETEHQAAFSSQIDVPLARRRSQSFDRFCREVARLLAA